MLNLDSRIRAAAGVVGRRIGDQAVLVLPTTGEVKVINAVGARIWELVDGARTVGEIAAQIQAEYEVDLAQAQADTLDYVHRLSDQGVVHVQNPPSGTM